MLLLALLCISLAIVLPQFLRHGWRRGMLVLLGVGVIAALGLGAILVLVWLMENVGRKGGGWGDRALRFIGHLLRFILFGLMGAILGVALISGHNLETAREDILSAVSGLAGGLGGCLFHRILGPPRFWVAFRRLCLALLGSLLGGILGILGPEPWSVSAGILLPLLAFVVLAALGRIAPPQRRDDPPPS